MNNIISCEHAGNSVPENYKSLFIGAEQVLESHRGWDPGALEVATFLSQNLNWPLYSMRVTRLLIEMNRSLENSELFSEFSSEISEEEKNALLEEYYYPYRNRIEKKILNAEKPIRHFSIHTFTPIFNQVERQVDLGLLFDPNRYSEQRTCEFMKEILEKSLPAMVIKFNEPYNGTDDGLTTSLRKKFSDDEYEGIEIEINQKYVNSNAFSSICLALLEAIQVE